MIDYGKVHPPKRDWDEAEDAILREMFEAGRTDRDIAGELGRTERSVANRRSRVGLLGRPRGSSGSIETIKTTSLVRELRRRGWTCKPPPDTAPEPTCFAEDAARCQ